MKLQPASLIPVGIAAGVAGLLAWVAVFPAELAERVEAITFDWRVKQAQSLVSPVSTNLGFVEINDATIEALKNGSLDFTHGLYWPRHVYGRAVRELRAQGARVVAFDVLFGELRGDHAQVPVSTNQWPDVVDFLATLRPDESPAAYRAGSEWFTLLDSDDYFAWQLQRAGMVLLAADNRVLPPPLFTTNAVALGDISAEKDPDGVLRRARAFRLYRQWHPLFLQAARDYGVDLTLAKIGPRQIQLQLPDGSASPPIELDEQGRFALADLVGNKLPASLPSHALPFTETRVWHMGVQLAARVLGLDLDHAEVDMPAGRITLRGTNGLQRVLPVDAGGFFCIDWSLPVTDERLTKQNFAALLEKDRDRGLGRTNEIPELWAGKVVVIGSTATGNDLTDLGATPLAKETFLLSKHWNVANSILQDSFIRRASLGVEIGLLFLLAALAAGLTVALRPPWSSLGVAAAGAAYVLAATWTYSHFRLWLPLALPLAGALVLTHGCVVAYQAFFEQREKRRVRSVFSKMVSPSVVNELLRAKNLSLGGALREVTVFFADVRGFTKFTDESQERVTEYIRQHGLSGEAAEACHAKQARETLATVNLYLALVADTVIKHDGTLDKYIGDCVMAFWGAPTPSKQHAVNCVRAAVDAQRAVYELNQRRAEENKGIQAENQDRLAAGKPELPLRPLLHLGTGINTGVVTVGLMGSEKYNRNYTVFGGDVNLASRLEGVSGHGRVVISEATYRHLLRDDPDLAKTCIALPSVTVKGIRAAVSIYEVPWRTTGEAGDTELIGSSRRPAG